MVAALSLTSMCHKYCNEGGVRNCYVHNARPTSATRPDRPADRAPLLSCEVTTVVLHVPVARLPFQERSGLTCS